jgi:formate dehydrogenase subunit delta
MANDIARYFASEPDHEEAVAGIATHLRRFWEPRMRSAIITHCRDHASAGLHPLAHEAVSRLAETQPGK